MNRKIEIQFFIFGKLHPILHTFSENLVELNNRASILKIRMLIIRIAVNTSHFSL